jgi:hypothetical protein
MTTAMPLATGAAELVSRQLPQAAERFKLGVGPKLREGTGG